MNIFSPLILLFLLPFLLLTEAFPFVDVFIGAFMGHMLGDMAGEHKKLFTKIFLGGPTSMATHALKNVTPFLGPSILGERFDQFLYTTLGWVVGFVVNLITGIIENTLAWSIEGALLANHGLLIFLDAITPGKRRELTTELFPAISTLLKGASASSNTTAIGLEEISRAGRFYPGGERALGARYDVTDQLLEKNPLLERFLKAVEEDSEEDCLKELLCSIYASTGGNLTKEELKLKLDFRELVKKYNVFFPSLSPLVKASNTGEKGASQKTCQEAYPNCTYPVLNRALFLFLTRFKAMREH